MTKMIPVTIHVPARTWWQISRIAERRGQNIADVVLEAALTIDQDRAQHRPRTTTRSEVARLTAEGRTIPEIATILGCTRENVHQHLKRLKTVISSNTT